MDREINGKHRTLNSETNRSCFLYRKEALRYVFRQTQDIPPLLTYLIDKFHKPNSSVT